MKIFRKVREQRKYSLEKKCNGFKTALVPTMGYLHEGHLNLIDTARKNADIIMVSIFVNPTQFGPDEDFKEYPRDEERDCRLLKERGVDSVFIPPVEEIYSDNFKTSVRVKKLSKKYCGRSRPTHFEGVTTIVSKLFNIIMPEVAVFGEKDYQQYIIIKRMCEDLNYSIEIIPSPIVREKDGLAMSSRNEYLSEEEREEAPVLYNSMLLAQEIVHEGEKRVKKIKKEMEDFINSRKFPEIDYIEFVEPETLEKVDRVDKPVRILMAVKIGRARLIDNLEITPPGDGN